MEHRRIGTSDLVISRIGFGCWAIGGHGYGKVDDSTSKEAISKAVELGINFFDTANVYGFGHSEEVLADALGEKRRNAVIATKGGVKWDAQGRTYRDCSPNAILESLHDSLRRLRIDCIPLYQVHWHDGRTGITELMEVLERCRQAGKINYMGCCNFPLPLIREAAATAKLTSIQALYNVKRRENEETFRECFSSIGLGVLVYEILGRGVFSGKYGVESKFGRDDTRARDLEFRNGKIQENISIWQALKNIGSKYGKTAVQVAIRWVLDNDFVTSAIIGAKTSMQVSEHIGAIGWKLELEDREILDSRC